MSDSEINYITRDSVIFKRGVLVEFWPSEFFHNISDDLIFFLSILATVLKPNLLN